jgi:hypothetical protein
MRKFAIRKGQQINIPQKTPKSGTQIYIATFLEKTPQIMTTASKRRKTLSLERKQEKQHISFL